MNFRPGPSITKKNPKIKSPSTIFFVLALAAFLTAGFLTTQVLHLFTPQVKVIAASKNIRAGEVLSKDNLQVIEYPKNMVPQDAVTSDLAGKHARTDIIAGDVIRKGHVAEISQGGTLAARLTYEGDDLRAIALPPDATLGLMGVSSGDLVDIALVAPAPLDIGGYISDEMAARVIIQQAPILDAYLNPDTGLVEGSVVIAVTPTDFEKLSLGLSVGGRVFAAVTPLGDIDKYHARGAGVVDLLQVSNPTPVTELEQQGEPEQQVEVEENETQSE